jgi:hypothetical protein
MERLPNELVHIILKYLKNKDVLSCLLANRCFTIPKCHIKERLKTQWVKTCIFDLVEKGDLQGVKYLISNNVNTCNKPLCRYHILNHCEGSNKINIFTAIASEKGHIAIIEYLHNNFSINYDIAMASAISSGQLSIVTYLRSIGTEIHQNAMATACCVGHVNIVNYLYMNGKKATYDHFNLAIIQGHLSIVIFSYMFLHSVIVVFL